MSKVSPLYIEIALHYYCFPSEFPRSDTIAFQSAVAELLTRGLLREGTKRRYEPTDGLTEWVNALCSVPFPVLTWTIPK